ncbi:hypothetical protein [Thalassotalea fusca]
MESAFSIFEKHYKSIQDLIRTADIYTIHAFAKLKGTEADLELINNIMNDHNCHSTLVNAWYFHMSKEENDLLRQDPHIKTICEQIVTSSFVSVEYYLVNRFKELIHKKVTNKNIANSVCKLSNGTSLQKLHEKYKNFLDIDLSKFEQDVCLFENNWFNPDNCWQALNMMSKVRNEVAHTGSSNTYQITYLLDAYSPYHFIWRWVGLFDSKSMSTE